eukprot:1228041-Alexandrium_andersonii.AAC.1
MGAVPRLRKPSMDLATMQHRVVSSVPARQRTWAGPHITDMANAACLFQHTEELVKGLVPLRGPH